MAQSLIADYDVEFVNIFGKSVLGDPRQSVAAAMAGGRHELRIVESALRFAETLSNNEIAALALKTLLEEQGIAPGLYLHPDHIEQLEKEAL